jgi:hypothetical protein
MHLLRAGHGMCYVQSILGCVPESRVDMRFFHSVLYQR